MDRGIFVGTSSVTYATQNSTSCWGAGATFPNGDQSTATDADACAAKCTADSTCVAYSYSIWNTVGAPHPDYCVKHTAAECTTLHEQSDTNWVFGRKQSAGPRGGVLRANFGKFLSFSAVCRSVVAKIVRPAEGALSRGGRGAQFSSRGWSTLRTRNRRERVL